MKIKVKNLGVLKQAEFELGDFTIICGANNTGKTYATYALFGFLFRWRRIFFIKINDNEIDQLLAEGVTKINIKNYAEQAQKTIHDGCAIYSKELPTIFATAKDRFKETDFKVVLKIKDSYLKREFSGTISSSQTQIFSIKTSEDNTELIVTLLAKKEDVKIPNSVIEDIISDALKDIIFSKSFPKSFIASAERTGAAIFRKELDFARKRLLEEIGQSNKNIDLMELLLKEYKDYALPIKENVDFIRQLETIAKKSSFLAENHPEILDYFADIIGGKYTVTSNDELYYEPKGKRIKLTMDESSSAVRSLLDLGFYLRHEAQPGDLLMIDEPELNLHPENQRRVARLLARLVNLGIKVFITTHSDYIIKELNTLIMLNHDKPHLKRIAEVEGYQQNELLNADQIKVYIAEEAPVLLDGKTRKTKCQTLTPANIDPFMGIDARSFDKTIDTMNRIQRAIVWGED